VELLLREEQQSVEERVVIGHNERVLQRQVGRHTVPEGHPGSTGLVSIRLQLGKQSVQLLLTVGTRATIQARVPPYEISALSDKPLFVTFALSVWRFFCQSWLL
jgi:hypothetical protein